MITPQQFLSLNLEYLTYQTNIYSDLPCRQKSQLTGSQTAVSRNSVRNKHILESTTFSVVCAADADLTFRSRDGILFKVHRNNLAAHSEGFSPPPGTTSQDEFVALLENGDTLDLLFQFMSPQRQPDLAGIMFMKLAELAEAAEKYQVFSAMTVCNIYMTYVA